MLVDLADVKTYIGESGNDYNDFLNQQIEVISDAVELYCRRKIISAEYVETIYYNELIKYSKYTDRLMLFHFPITAVDEVLADGVEITEGFRFNGAGYLVRSDKSFWINNFSEKLEVTYTAGYADTPSVIKEVIYSIINERYNKKKNGIAISFGSDVQRVSIPGVMSIDFDYTLQSNERKTTLGMILGNWVNVLDSFRTERAIMGTVALKYVE